MSSSGITVDPEAVASYEYLKKNRSSKFITFKIENRRKIVVDIQSEAGSAETEEDKVWFQKMMTHCQSEPRYIVYDFTFSVRSGIRSTLGFIFW